MSKIVGIDLGTTNSCVAVMEGGHPVVIANAEGTRTTPSVVAFNKKKELLTGEIAKRQAIINHGNTFHSVKRLMGRDMAELETEAKELSFEIKEDQSRVKIECPILNNTFSPEEISARILQKLAIDASDYLGQTVTQAIVTVPAYFNDSQRQATRDAAQIAGLDVIRIITEPVAAALAYGLNLKKLQFVLVFDLGGGTFDVSVLEISADNVFEVLSTSGDTHLGGDDFDQLIVDFLANNFKAVEGIDLRQDKQALQRLTEAAEKAKIELSYATVSDVSLPFITANADGPKHLDISITRDQFENLSAPLIRRCLMAVEQALKDANLSSPNELDQILLVGGSTRIPAIEDMIYNKLGTKPNKTVNPDEIVALGAAIQAGILSEEVKNVLLLDVTPLSLGIRTESDRVSVLIPKNKTTPTKFTKAFATASDNQTSVKINIIQGDNEYARDNKSLGIFTLSGLRPAPRGETKVNVTFDVDSNGILSVTAIDENTGKEQSITISDTSRLEPAEIDQMTKDAAEDIDTPFSVGEGKFATSEIREFNFTDYKKASNIEGMLIKLKDNAATEEINSLINVSGTSFGYESHEKSVEKYLLRNVCTTLEDYGRMFLVKISSRNSCDGVITGNGTGYVPKNYGDPCGTDEYIFYNQFLWNPKEFEQLILSRMELTKLNLLKIASADEKLLPKLHKLAILMDIMQGSVFMEFNDDLIRLISFSLDGNRDVRGGSLIIYDLKVQKTSLITFSGEIGAFEADGNPIFFNDNEVEEHTESLDENDVRRLAISYGFNETNLDQLLTLSCQLTGSKLLSKVKELGDVNKSELAKGCGYMIKRKDGSEKILFTAFYEALLRAKGVDVESVENKQDENLLLTREEEKLKTDFIGYPEFGTENIILSGEERAKAELKVLLSWYSRCLSFMFDIGEKLFQKGESSSQFISFADTLHIIEIELKRRQSMFAKVFRQLDYDHIQELIHKTSSSEDVMWKWFVNEIEKLSIDDAVQIDEDTGAVRLADEYTVGVIDGKYMIRKSNLVSTETTHDVQYTEPINATFKLLTRLVIDDKEFDQRIFSAYCAEYRDKFKIPLQKSWFDSVIALKGSAYMSLKYEVFSEFFSDDINKITDRIMDYCSNPSWDADDELPGHIDGLLLGIQELYPLCKYLSISEQDVLKLLFTNDGIEIDSVTINPELIRCVEEFESGEVDKEEFEDELKDFDDNNPMFDVELHLTMKSCLNYDNCRERFEEEFNDYIPGIENIESAEYAKFIQLCNAFAASLVKEFIPHNK